MTSYLSAVGLWRCTEVCSGYCISISLILGVNHSANWVFCQRPSGGWVKLCLVFSLQSSLQNHD